MSKLLTRALSRIGATITLVTILLAAVSMHSLLSAFAVDGLHVDSIARQITLASSDFHEDLQSDLRFDDALARPASLALSLRHFREKLAQVLRLDPRNLGVTLVDHRGVPVTIDHGAALPRTLNTISTKLATMRRDSRGGKVQRFIENELVGAVFLLRGVDEKVLGGLAIVTKQGTTTERLLGIYEHDLEGLVLPFLLSAGILCLVGSLLFLRRSKRAGVLTILTYLGVFGVATTLWLEGYWPTHLEHQSRATRIVSDGLRAEIEGATSLGIRIEHLADLGPTLGRYGDLIKGRSITIAGPDGSELARWDAPEDPNSLVSWGARLLGMNAARPFRIEVNAGANRRSVISVKSSAGKTLVTMWSAISGLVTVFVIGLLIAGEGLVLCARVLSSEPEGASPTEPRPGSAVSVIRPATFFFLFGIDISLSFVPLHMEQLPDAVFGLSRDIVLGLPISAEFAAVGISLLVAGYWMDHKGWRQPFFFGIVFASVGVLYSSFSTDAYNFIASRALVGVGYGLTLMASQGFVLQNAGANQRTQGLAQMFAGLYAGSLCGSAVGAMLAERIDYIDVFRLGGIVLALVAVYGVVVLRRYQTVAQKRPTEQTETVSSTRLTIRFLTDRRVAAVMLLASMPAAIAVVGFLNYFTPVYLHREGLTQNTIGQVLLIYGVMLVVCGPPISRLVDVSGARRLSVFVGSILGGLAFCTFEYVSGVMGAVFAMVLMGLSSSCILAAQSTFLLWIPATQKLGEGKAIGIFRASSRIGQVLGPLVFAGLFSLASIEGGMVVFGMVYLASSLAFIIFSVPPRALADWYGRWRLFPLRARGPARGT